MAMKKADPKLAKQAKKDIKFLKEKAAPKKPAVKTTVKKTTPMPKVTTKPKPKPKVVQMPSKISPFKMTPAQKAEYLKNPDRYNG
jgi:hypothetical protein